MSYGGGNGFWDIGHVLLWPKVPCELRIFEIRLLLSLRQQTTDRRASSSPIRLNKLYRASSDFLDCPEMALQSARSHQIGSSGATAAAPEGIIYSELVRAMRQLHPERSQDSLSNDVVILDRHFRSKAPQAGDVPEP